MAKTLQSPAQEDVDRLADFIMFTQRSFLLDLSRELNDGNVSYAQFFLLSYLQSEDFLTMSEIARKMGHSTAAATGLVDRLEKLGYVQRLHSEEDRRKVIVRITKQGARLVAQIRKSIVDGLSDYLQAGGESGGGTLAALAKRLPQV